jgi:hypothetical protein
MFDIYMSKSDGEKLAMVMVVSEVLEMRKGRKDLSHEEMMRDLDSFIHKTKNNNARLMMVVAASKTLDVINRNPRMTDKEIMRIMVNDFDSLIEIAGTDN